MPNINEQFLEACIHNPLIALNLLQGLVVDVNITNDDKNTPLHFAVISSCPKLVSKLLEVGANQNAQNNSGITPLHIAVKMSKLEMINILIFVGASLKLKDSNGMTPIDLAKSTGNTDLADFMETSRRNLKTQLWVLPARINRLEYQLDELKNLVGQQQEIISHLLQETQWLKKPPQMDDSKLFKKPSDKSSKTPTSSAFFKQERSLPHMPHFVSSNLPPYWSNISPPQAPTVSPASSDAS